MWTALQRFGQLEVLDMHICDIQSKESIDSLLSVVATVDTLRSLSLRMSSYPKHTVGDVFCSLTNLQSLSLLIAACGRPRHVSVCVSQLTQLTSLALEGVSIQGSVVPLDKLSHFSLQKSPPISEDLGNALTQLTRLTELLWNDERLPSLPNYVLSQLKSLRRLTLDTQDDLDAEFFQSLASLTDLTSLVLWSRSKVRHEDSFRKQFTMLSQLQGLRLFCGHVVEFDVLRLFGEGTFPRLRYLRITNLKLEEGDEQILFSRFPCLRSFSR